MNRGSIPSIQQYISYHWEPRLRGAHSLRRNSSMATEVLVSTGSPSLQSLVTVVTSAGTRESRRRRVELGGILLDQIGMAGALDRIEDFVNSGTPHQIVTVNLDFVTIASRDAEFRATLNSADL